MKMKTMLSLSLSLVPFLWFDYILGWKCLYKEFPVDRQKIAGLWWIYGTNPEASKLCLFEQLDLYWTRITMSDYDNYAIELHCSLPWFRHQMAIYTRVRDPTQETLKHIDDYLKSVKLSRKNFKLIDRQTCQNRTDPMKPMQRWHLSKYMHLDYNPHYVKPLVVNENI
ncbi:uncharacterized protein LOC6645599 [Drosophila willistoni]|nr:uncharacterized protein LOC6645599 [Drosophila willistoni]